MWALTRAAIYGGCFFVVVAAYGLAPLPRALLALPVIPLAGLLFLALALRHVPSTHGAVVTALLPLSTAVLGALWYRQRPSSGFWACAVVGSTLVLGFMVWRAGGVYLGAANIYLLIAMTTGALGYIGGARLTPRLGAEQVICWVLVCCLPLTLPMAWWFAPSAASAIHASSWMGFAYVSLFSMWIGFFAWYRALALGGTVLMGLATSGAAFIGSTGVLIGLAQSGTTYAIVYGVIARNVAPERQRLP